MARIFQTEMLPELLHLSLEKNSIGDEGLATLAIALSQGSLKNLIRLTLTDNALTDGGIEALAGSLRAGALPALQWLYLNSNQIGDGAVETLAATLRENCLPNLQASRPCRAMPPQMSLFVPPAKRYGASRASTQRSVSALPLASPPHLTTPPNLTSPPSHLARASSRAARHV